MSAIVKSGPVNGGLTFSGAVRMEGIGDVFKLADVLAKADDFVPKALRGKPAGIAAVILKGVEMGVGPMEALSSLHLIEGKVAMDATYVLARLHAFGFKTDWLTSDTDRTKATIQITKPDGRKATSTFTIEDAREAQLAGKGTWAKYPNQMLRRRATTKAAREHAPEVFNGPVYTPDELRAPEQSETPRVEVLPASSKPTLDDLAAPTFDVLALLDQIAAIEDRDDLNSMRESLNADPPKCSKGDKVKIREALNATQARIDARDETAAIAAEGQVM